MGAVIVLFVIVAVVYVQAHGKYTARQYRLYQRDQEREWRRRRARRRRR